MEYFWVFAINELRHGRQMEWEETVVDSVQRRGVVEDRDQ